MEGFEKRAQEIADKRLALKKRKWEEEKNARDRLIKEQLERVLTLLEATEDDIVVKTTDCVSEVVMFLRRFYDVNPSYAPDDDDYHSLWRISTKNE